MLGMTFAVRIAFAAKVPLPRGTRRSFSLGRKTCLLFSIIILNVHNGTFVNSIVYNMTVTVLMKDSDQIQYELISDYIGDVSVIYLGYCRCKARVEQPNGHNRSTHAKYHGEDVVSE